MGEGGEPVRDMSEAEWEALAMETLAELAWEPVTGGRIAPGTGERDSWSELILPGRLRDAVARINPRLPQAVADDVVRGVLTAKSRDPFAENHRLHTLLTKGTRSVVYTDDHGAEHNPHRPDRRLPGPGRQRLPGCQPGHRD
jgi:type I restriction enzyme R subunit